MDRTKKFFLLLLDWIVLSACICSVAYLRDAVPPERVLFSAGYLFISTTVMALTYIFGGYDLTPTVTVRRVFARGVLALTFSLGVVVLINYFGAKDRSGVFGRGVLVGSFVAFGFFASLIRVSWVAVLRKASRKARWLFVCTRNVYANIRMDLEKNSFQGQTFFLLDNTDQADDRDVLGRWSDFPEVLKKSWTSITVALDETAPKSLIEQLMLARFEAIKVRDLVQFYEEQWKKVPLYYLGANWFLLTEGFDLFGNPVRKRLKRLLDVAFSLVMLLLSVPVMILAWIAIRLESSGGAIYKQVRTGKDGRDFTIYKFRSMRSDAEKDGVQWAATNDDRITKVGRFIRKTRIDELPQLVNILQGRMSLVGPRPERPEFNQMLHEKIPFYYLRHMIHPGLTGWAQVLYPYGASVEDAQEKLQYELFYIKNYSLWLDLSIVLKTVQVVLFGKGR